jgi:putative membrane protein
MRFGYDGFAGIGLIGLIWIALSIAFTVLIIVLIVLGIRWLLQHSGSGLHAGPPREDTALAVLRERFARGEIDADELRQRRSVLRGKR